MLSSVTSFTLHGISARPVRVEVDVHRGLPGFAIVGLPDAAVREARERVRAALVNCGFEFPLSRIVVNLAPASLRKAGPGMDLAIAAGLLRASEQLEWEGMDRVAFAGELALDGGVRSINGALAIAEAAREDGVEAIVVPSDNGPEAALAGGVGVMPLRSLAELPALAAGERGPEPLPLRQRTGPAPGTPDLADLRGQPHLRHALEVAAAGGHSLLMVGPPGAGKSLAASRLPSILPPLGGDEALEVARIASATGRLGAGLPAGRPFRAPHHTISAAGLIGGGTPPRPGEVTLAHRGVLFLDELCEFRRDVLEALRAPLEAGEVAISRAGSRLRLPCRFMLVAAPTPARAGAARTTPTAPASPRPSIGTGIGSRAHSSVRSKCGSTYRCPPPRRSEDLPHETSAEVRERVVAARATAGRSAGRGPHERSMSRAEAGECPIADDAAELLGRLFGGWSRSELRRLRVLRLAQTIADLAEADRIGIDHIEEAAELCIGRLISASPDGVAEEPAGTPERANAVDRMYPDPNASTDLVELAEGLADVVESMLPDELDVLRRAAGAMREEFGESDSRSRRRLPRAHGRSDHRRAAGRLACGRR